MRTHDSFFNSLRHLVENYIESAKRERAILARRNVYNALQFVVCKECALKIKKIQGDEHR